jgi:hypothetical protein
VPVQPVAYAHVCLMDVVTLIIIAIAIALDPLPLVPFILLLASKRGVRKGAAFLFGWFLSLAVITAGTIFLSGSEPPAHGSPPAWVSVVIKLVIGLVLLYIGLRKRRAMAGPPKPKATPKWQAGIDDMSLWFAMALAPITQPWGLIAAGVAAVMALGAASAGSIVLLIVFVLLATSSYLVLEIGAAFRPERAQAVSTSIRTWIEAHTDQAIVLGSIGIGLFLVASSAYQMLT